MPVMMIRGGDLDLVEYEFRAFLPARSKRSALKKILTGCVPKKVKLS